MKRIIRIISVCIALFGICYFFTLTKHDREVFEKVTEYSGLTFTIMGLIVCGLSFLSELFHWLIGPFGAGLLKLVATILSTILCIFFLRSSSAIYSVGIGYFGVIAVFVGLSHLLPHLIYEKD
jgi:hypothetical protein